MKFSLYKKINEIWYNFFIFLWFKDPTLIKESLIIFFRSIFTSNYYISSRSTIREILEKYWNYIFSIDFESKKVTLLKWLDDVSIETVNDNLNKIFKLFKKDIYLYNELYSLKEINEQKVVSKSLKIIENEKKYKLPIRHFESCVFHYNYWIYNIKWISNILVWKNIIDCWWFIWDSCLMFAKEFNYWKIYVYEPLNKNIDYINETIKLNDLKNIEIKNCWVWDFNWKIWIVNEWSASYVSESSDDIINIVKLDDQDIYNVWIIKMDIEWYEYNAIMWAKNIIFRDKPVLLISIYHNWRDFFEIKPLIESWKLWYKFYIRKHNPFSLYWETILIWYV